MSEKPARFEVHALPLAAIDAVLQICRFIKIEAPYIGVNVRIAKGDEEGVWWARVEYVEKRWSVTLRIEAYQGVTGAIFDTYFKENFFTLGARGSDGCYRITQELTAPFGNNPFSAEDFYHHSDEVLSRRPIVQKDDFNCKVEEILLRASKYAHPHYQVAPDVAEEADAALGITN